MISKSTYRKIIFYELIMIVILVVMIYQEATSNKYSAMLEDYKHIKTGEYNGQGYHVYQCPSGTIVISFDEEENIEE